MSVKKYLSFLMPSTVTHTIWQGLAVLQNLYILLKVWRDMPLTA